VCMRVLWLNGGLGYRQVASSRCLRLTHFPRRST
jgi:hypothetical protein